MMERLRLNLPFIEPCKLGTAGISCRMRFLSNRTIELLTFHFLWTLDPCRLEYVLARYRRYPQYLLLLFCYTLRATETDILCF